MNSPSRDTQNLRAFWNSALKLTEQDKEEILREGAPDLHALAPCEKLYRAAAMLKERKKILDYGCGTGWASLIAAGNGAHDVTAADTAHSAIEAVRFFADLYGTEDAVKTCLITDGWLDAQPKESYDGLFCSNVLDVIPSEEAERIIRGFSRIVKEEADVIIGLNYYLSPEEAYRRGLNLQEGRNLYADGVLRLVSRSDAEWAELFAPYFTVKELDHFAWANESSENRRLFFLKKKQK